MKLLTDPQIKFIIENRMISSIIDMAKQIETTPYRVRKYMFENNLTLDNECVQKIRVKKRNHNGLKKPVQIEDDYEPAKWISDPWNHSINSVTFFRVQLLK